MSHVYTTLNRTVAVTTYLRRLSNSNGKKEKEKREEVSFYKLKKCSAYTRLKILARVDNCIIWNEQIKIYFFIHEFRKKVQQKPTQIGSNKNCQVFNLTTMNDFRKGH